VPETGWGIAVDLRLVRHTLRAEATLGSLYAPALHLPTIECPWRENRPFVSCVPAGRYRLARHDTEAHPECFALVNPELHVVHEPGEIPAGAAGWRYAILIHVANWASELCGCIAVGGDARTRAKDRW
jgi:hypothetical protein